MITQRQIRDWIPETLSVFQKAMPHISIPYPEIFIASSRTCDTLRNRLITDTGCLLDKGSAPTAIMEIIYGDKGSAIIIYQQRCSESFSGFQHELWHELGHFYALANETKPFFTFMRPGLAVEREMQEGYWLWKEFVAESIAYTVEKHLYGSPSMNTVINHNYWEPLYRQLQHYLRVVFQTYQYTVDEDALGYYFASLLFDERFKVIQRAASDCRLMVLGSAFKPETMKPNTLDPSALTEWPKIIQDRMNTILSFLDNHIKRHDDWWTCNEDLLYNIGCEVLELHILKQLHIHPATLWASGTGIAE